MIDYYNFPFLIEIEVDQTYKVCGKIPLYFKGGAKTTRLKDY